ncbi:MAG: hypothetical protein OFPI_39700 [Osedax symbiont Rs2]|nr:MAG: hypothetical protein OFPI_39700 [Osedax symbiont Rs2]
MIGGVDGFIFSAHKITRTNSNRSKLTYSVKLRSLKEVS